MPLPKTIHFFALGISVLLLGYACVDEDGTQPAVLTLLRCIARHYPAMLCQPLPPPLAGLE